MTDVFQAQIAHKGGCMASRGGADGCMAASRGGADGKRSCDPTFSCWEDQTFMALYDGALLPALSS